MLQFSTTIGIDTSATKIFWRFPLMDAQGRVKYTFVCVGGSTSYLDKLSDKTGINYVGPFACRLIKGTSDTESSLLSEDDSAYWYSRGQLHDYRDLIGACGRYPEYGTVRHFRLRGFDLTMHFANVDLDKRGDPTYLTLTVSLRRDPAATSVQAAQTGYLTPYRLGRSCEHILKGYPPRMCRDWKRGGSWTECDKLK